MSTDIKFSKAQLPKMIQTGVFLRHMLSNLSKKALANVAMPLARDNLLGLVSNLTSNVFNKFETKISGKGAVRAGKRFNLFILNEDMNDIINIIKSLEAPNVLNDAITETVKQ